MAAGRGARDQTRRLKLAGPEVVTRMRLLKRVACLCALAFARIVQRCAPQDA